MPNPRMIALALAGLCALAGGCSSSGSGGPADSSPGTIAPAPSVSSSAGAPSPAAPSLASPPASAGAGAAAVQQYVDAVNRLCDALLPKVIAVTHGGSLDIPVKAYLAQQPAHQKLLADFDRKLARVPVPAAARRQAATFAAYVRFADRLDAKRLAAARKGAAAYAAEIRAEANVEDAPAITARNAAGFAPSCDAR